MNTVVVGIYERDIVKLKTEIKAPNNSEVPVAFKDRGDRE